MFLKNKRKGGEEDDEDSPPEIGSEPEQIGDNQPNMETNQKPDLETTQIEGKLLVRPTGQLKE